MIVFLLKIMSLLCAVNTSFVHVRFLSICDKHDTINIFQLVTSISHHYTKLNYNYIFQYLFYNICLIWQDILRFLE